MFRRMFGAIKHASKDEGFTAVLGAAVLLVLIGTITYTLAEGWKLIDGFYFAVATLTTSSIADPSLTLTSGAIKVFTALYVLTGIGILVELARQIGFGYVKVREERGEARRARHEGADPSAPQPPG
jgi:Ion channel